MVVNKKFGKSKLYIGNDNHVCFLHNFFPLEIDSTDTYKLYCSHDNVAYSLDDIDIRLVAHGNNHLCVYDFKGETQCTGDNQYHQLDTPPNLKYISQMVAGKYHTCAYMNSPSRVRSIKCWGDNEYNQLEVPPAVTNKMRTTDVLSLTAGQHVTCVTFDEKNVISYCWGLNRFELYDESNVVAKVGKASEVEIVIGSNDTYCATYTIGSTLGPIRTIKCWGRCNDEMCMVPAEYSKKMYSKKNVSAGVGFNHVCTQVDHGYVRELACWGNNAYGQTSVPKDYSLKTISYVVGSNFTCGVKYNTNVTCWGQRASIVDVTNHLARQVSAGGRHTCANIGGSLQCFGNNEFLQLDPPVDHVHNSIQVEAGWDYNCSVSVDRKLACWGFNVLSQIEVPARLEYDGVRVNEVAVGLHHSCARFKDPNQENNVLCWGGHDEFGQTSIAEKYRVGVLKMAVGDYHTCLLYREIKKNNMYGLYGVSCMGSNEYGQIDHPFRKVEGNVSALVAGDGHTCLAKYSAYLVYCWGSDSHGQSTVPVQYRESRGVHVNTMLVIITINAGTVHTCAIRLLAAGVSQFECWGMDLYPPGDKIYTGYQWAISTGWMHNCVIDTYYDLKCYGENEYAQCNVPEYIDILIHV